MDTDDLDIIVEGLYTESSYYDHEFTYEVDSELDNPNLVGYDVHAIAKFEHTPAQHGGMSDPSWKEHLSLIDGYTPKIIAYGEDGEGREISLEDIPDVDKKAIDKEFERAWEREQDELLKSKGKDY